VVGGVEVLVLAVAEQVNVVLLTGREGLVGLRTRHELDLDLGSTADEDGAGKRLAEVVVLCLDVDQLLLLTRELGPLSFDGAHQVLVERSVELRIVFGDPAHEGTTAVIAVATLHQLGVDLLEVLRVLAADAGLLLDDLPGGIEHHLQVLLLSLGQIARTHLSISVVDVHPDRHHGDDSQAQEADEKSLVLHDLTSFCFSHIRHPCAVIATQIRMPDSNETSLACQPKTSL